MKKLFSLFVPLMALFLTLAPQTAKADVTSPIAEVNVFENRLDNSTIDTTRIVYQLVTTTDASGNSYIPVDMGYGVAWADKCVGATSNTVKGDYYRWGNTTKQTANPTNSTYYSGLSSMNVGDEIPVDDDAAAQVMGRDANNRMVWRMPSADEWTALTENCKLTHSSYANATDFLYITFTSKNSTNNIRIYPCGYMKSTTTPTATGRIYCWSRTLSWKYTTSLGYSSPSIFYSWKNSKTATTPSFQIRYVNSYGSDAFPAAYHAYNVRGIYTPPFTTHKLTIKAQLETSGSASSKASVFVCEEGQTIRVTARPKAGKYFLRWSDGDTHKTRDFSLSADLTVTAIYTATEPVSSYTIRFLNYDNEVLQTSALGSGATPAYGGSTPTKPSDIDYKYSFSGWSPTIANVTQDQDYVAQFSSSDLTHSITVPNVEHGTITASVGGNSYAEGDVITDIARGTTITFTAVPDSHYELTGWSGALSGTSLSTTLTTTRGMDETISVGAAFALEQFTVTAALDNALHGSVTGGNTYNYGTSVTVTATANDGYRFVNWSNGESSVSSNASYTFTLSENVTLTANFALESVDQTVDVYQNTTADVTKILYALTPKTVGGITYTPIDMGYGVAWADRNIGAETENAVGSLFYWGGTSATNTFRSGEKGTYQTGTTSVAAEADFSTDYDAAYQIIGHYWRVPSKSDWQALINEYGSVTTFTSKISNEGFSLPANGYIQSEVSSQTQLSSSEADYWSRTKGYKGSGHNDRAWVFKNGSMNSGVTGYASYGLPIRPIYQPTFTIYTLTINVGSYKYIYKCQSGQNITVDVHATELGATFNEWSEDHNTNATRTFTVTADATYTASFAAAPTYTLAWSSSGSAPSGGTAAGSYIAGITITAPTTSKTGYTVSKWRDETNGVDFNGTMPANNVTYTAQWTANTYYVSFDPGEGSGSAMSNQTFTYGETKPLTANSYTGPSATVTYNYNGATGGIGAASETVHGTPLGWTDEEDNYYEEEQSVSNLTTENGATIALTALWDWTEEVTLPSPTKTGYTFNQWQDEIDPGFVNVIGKGGVKYAPSEDITATAKWDAITYNLTYTGLEGASNSNPASYTIETATITLADPGTRTGYTFTGWTCGGTPITQIALGSTGDKTITANWSLNTDVVLPDNTDNSDLLAIYNGHEVNVTVGRTFYADGNWGTVCLPFELSIAGTAFDGAEVRTMSNAYIYNKGSENEKLIIECDESTSTTTLTAGRPYIIRFAAGDNIVSPTFNGVTISVTSAGNVVGTDLNFIGLLAPQALATDGSNLFLGGNNTLYKPSPSSATVNAFRAYFAYKEVLAKYPRRSMMVFDKGAQMPTDVEIVTPEDKPLDGKRIENGQLVIYRNGMRYNVAGQLLD